MEKPNAVDEYDLKLLEDTVDKRIDNMIEDLVRLSAALKGLKEYKALIFGDMKYTLKKHSKRRSQA